MKKEKKTKEPFLWPVPQKVKWTEGVNVVPANFSVAGAFTKNAAFFSIWQRFWQSFHNDGREHATWKDERSAWLRVERVSALPNEGYRLQIQRGGVSLQAADVRGAIHGLLTLRQFFRNRTLPSNAAEYTSLQRPELACCIIEDWPDYAVRGFMLDISRGKVPDFRGMLVIASALRELKCNHLQLYTEHTFAFTGHEKVWQESSANTAQDILTFQEWFEGVGIELSANFNSFGHFERWLKHPEYKHLAECPNGFEHPIKGKVPHGTTLRPNAASLKFLDKLWAEYLPLFKSRRFNLGGDEPWELGQGWSKPLGKKYGKHRVYLDFLKKLHQLAKKHGKEMLFWGDILLESPELVKEVPKDATALLWGYEADHPFAEQCAKLAKAKRKFWVCPGTSAWNTFTGRTDNMLANIESAVKHGLANGAEGFLLTSWGDGGNHQPWPIMYPGLIYAAGMAWNAKGTKRADLARAVNQVVFEGRGLVLAKALMAAGKIEAPLNEGLRNATRLHRWFFASTKEIENEANKFSLTTLTTVGNRLCELSLRVGKEAREPWENYYCREELKLGLDMAAWAARRAQLICARESTRRLKAELKKLIKRFEQLWLLHARPGGLPEAVARMRAVEKEL